MKKIIKIMFASMIAVSFFTINILADDTTESANLNHIDRVENSIIPKNAELIGVRESNEYLNILKEYKQYKYEAESNNFTSSQLKEIDAKFEKEQKEFDKHIEQLQLLSHEELRKEYNYKESQIEAIRNFDYTDELRLQSSASATLSHYRISFYDSGNKTYFSYGMEGNLYGITYSKSISFAMTAVGSSAGLMFNGSSLALNYHRGGFRYVSSNEREITQGIGNVWTVPPSQALQGMWQRITSFSGIYKGVGDRTNVVGIQSAIGRSAFSASFGFDLSNNGFGISITPKYQHHTLNKITNTITK